MNNHLYKFPNQVVSVAQKDVIAVDKTPDALEMSKRKIVVVHSNIIEPSFWEDHPWILD